MAVCKFGAIVTDMRGKLGGHVMQGNGFSNSMRTGYSGKGGMSTINQVFKDIVPIINNDWRSLSQIQKNNWQILANKHPIPNVLGDQIVLSGQNLHRRNYTSFFASGQTGIIDPTTAIGDINSDELRAMEIDLATPGIQMELNFDRSSPAYLFYAKLVSNKNTKIQPLKLRFFYGAFTPEPEQEDIYAAFIATFPNYVPGQDVQFGVSQVNEFGFKTFIKTVYGVYI